MEKFICEKTGDMCCRETLENGLTVYFSPNEYTSFYAVLTTRFGSVCSDYSVSGRRVTLPSGVAHFLEHKLFENESGGDAFELFAQTGADANAFTSYTQTSYLFSATDSFAESLGILTDFVFHPHFTEKSVKKEQGIIAEEIKMYDDSPAWRCYTSMLAGLYESHPVREDIAGSVESISEITPELLYDCCRTFYSPSNMTLCVAGNCDFDEILRICRENISPSAPVSYTVSFPEEKRGAYRDRTEDKMDISRPMFLLGVKDALCTAGRAERMKRENAAEILAGMLFGKSSELYTSLYDEGLIGEDFSTEYVCEESFSYFAIGGMSDDPDRVCGEIRKCIDSARDKGLDPDEFELSKKVVYSRCVRSFDSSAGVASDMAECGELIFAEPDMIASITPEYTYKLLLDLFVPEAYTVSVIKPIEKEEK